MSARRLGRSLAADTKGASAIEFALLGPVMIAMLMGILWTGVQMYSQNQLRAIASDVSRYTVVQYQKSIDEKSIKPTATQISEVAAATAMRAPYNLDASQLDVTVAEPASPVAGTKQFQITLSYTAPNFLGFLGVGSPTQTYTQNVYVPA